MQQLERQIAALERKQKEGKAKNPFAVKNKITNLKAQLAAQNKASYWANWLSR